MAFGKFTNKVQSVFREKNSKVLAMLGSIEVVNAIIDSKVFDEYDIELLRKDYATVEELFQGIKDNKHAKYVFLSDSALVGIENGKYEVVKQIRKQYPDITIVMFFNDEKQDETYKNWAYGYKVYHIYYASTEGFDFEKIASDLVENSITINNPINNNNELEEKEVFIRQKEKELQEKENQLHELEKRLAETEKMEPTEENSQQVVLLKEQIKKMQEFKKETEENINNIKRQHELEKEELQQKFEVEKKEYREKVDKEVKAQIQAIKDAIKIETPKSPQIKTLGCITIGVFSISHGAGSTYLARYLGEQLGGAGFPTAVIAMDGKKDLKYASGDYAHYIIPDESGKKVALLETISSGYNFVIEDFGHIFPISPDGKLETGNISDKKEDINELLRCTYKIAVGFSESWHLGKLNFFIESNLIEPSTSIYCIKGYENNKELAKCTLPICERNVDLITEYLFNLLGIMKKDKQEQLKKKGFFKQK